MKRLLHLYSVQSFASQQRFCASANNISVQPQTDDVSLHAALLATIRNTSPIASPWDDAPLNEVPSLSTPASLNISSRFLTAALYPNACAQHEESVLAEVEARSGLCKPRQGASGQGRGGLVDEVGILSSKWELKRRDALKERGCVIMLFSSTNLRVDDNYPLTLALEKAKELGVPVMTLFVFDGRTFAQPSSTAGFFRKSPERARFMIECVCSLRHTLEYEHGIPLLIRTGYPEFIIPDLCRAVNAKAVYASTQYAPHEKLIEESIRLQLTEGSRKTVNLNPIPFHTVWDSTLVHVDDLLTPASESMLWFLDDWHQHPTRPTAPYNCRDGRLQEHHAALSACLMAGGGSSAKLSPEVFRHIATIGKSESSAAETDAYDESLADELNASSDEASHMGNSISIAGLESSSGRVLTPIPLLFMPSIAERLFYDSNRNTPYAHCAVDGIVPNAIRGAIPTLAELGYKKECDDVPSIQSYRHGDVTFEGGELAALARLTEWEEHGGPKTYIRPGRDVAYATEMSKNAQLRISPWLSHGCISPRTLLERYRLFAQKDAVSGMAAQWYQESKQRLGRRDYWHYMGVRYGKSLFFPYGPRPEHTNNIPDWKMDDKIIKRWCHGLTGVPFADAAMRELVTTGFVANEGRQGLAWLLTRGYGQDWRVGAEWFERCSLDYDPFMNYGMFAYYSQLIQDDFSDTVHNVNYLAHKVDQTGLYVRQWVPEVAKLPSVYIHRPQVLTERMQKMHNVHLGANYPYPVKLWDGAQHQLSGDQLTSYFPTADQKAARIEQGKPAHSYLSHHGRYRGWDEAREFSSKLVPETHSPIVYLN